MKIKETDDLFQLNRQTKRELLEARGPGFAMFQGNNRRGTRFNDPLISLEYYFICMKFILSDPNINLKLMYIVYSACGYWLTPMVYCFMLFYLNVRPMSIASPDLP